MKFNFYILFCVTLILSFGEMAIGDSRLSIADRQQKEAQLQGVIIDHSPAESKKYLGSPSIAVLPNGDYIASHDFFGPGTKNDTTSVFRSKDSGKTWRHLTDIKGQWWSTLFVHKGHLYIMGASRADGKVVIRISLDGGLTWTTPRDGNTGLLADGKFATGPVPVVVHNGRIWRAMEKIDKGRWPSYYLAFVMSAPIDSNLLKKENWKTTNYLAFDPSCKKGSGWLEGNVVVTPEGKLVNILRTDYKADKAAIVRISDDGSKISFDPDNDFIDFPGGGAKFTIRYDQVTKKYWSLVNKQTDPAAYRNILVLTSSKDLRNWTVETIIYRHRNSVKVAWQYVDWLFEGNDIIVASRTASMESHKAHDADYMTFHRIKNFRNLTMEDSPDYLVDTKTYNGSKLIIEGCGFEVKDFRNDSLAFSNRDYIWKDIPLRLAHTKFTQTSGGEFAEISFTAKENTVVYIANTDSKSLSGWLPLNETFYYTDRGKTKLYIFTRRVKPSEKINVPQKGWAGTILFFKE